MEDALKQVSKCDAHGLSDVRVTLKGKEGGPAKNLYLSIYLSNYLVHYTLNYPERQTDGKKEKKMKNNEEFCKKPTAPGVPKRSPIQVLSGSLSDSLSDSLSLSLSL